MILCGALLCAHVCQWMIGAGTLFQRDGSLEEVDPEIASIIKNEKGRQVREGERKKEVERRKVA